ncbi:hypothetical protein EJB05_10790, partial [Eragrostis curvula]
MTSPASSSSCSTASRAPLSASLPDALAAAAAKAVVTAVGERRSIPRLRCSTTGKSACTEPLNN